ncbi:MULTISPECIES: siphovirus Gp157 family protein [unclassified Vibrio]|uniref:siphovirus Gp157 family protein n=1 Tax=unclassified Vibrio TaxID=2614977 RepID=UPI0013615A61|nr:MULTISPECIES: siphovirus Gp157 family protein [unclassified Vibrio]NAW56104.1 hypothetical protein [Vibrio sp. V36_P2S2PM302]NAX26551.1 hypothetical protein [Vibrio sp. V38_P2S17PM301]NAX30071.1 hypothetical protein [Vibrio sp. V37_P2S8PM304]
MNATIWTISEDVQGLLKLAEQNNWDASVIQDTLEGTGLEDKVNDWLKAISNEEATAKMLKEEKERLAERQKQYENNAKRMKECLHTVMKNLDIKTYKVPLGTLSRKDGGTSIQFEADKLPDSYFVYDTVKTPNKQLIEADMNAGKVVPGAYFEIKPETFSIRRR